MSPMSLDLMVGSVTESLFWWITSFRQDKSLLQPSKFSCYICFCSSLKCWSSEFSHSSCLDSEMLAFLHISRSGSDIFSICGSFQEEFLSLLRLWYLPFYSLEIPLKVFDRLSLLSFLFFFFPLFYFLSTNSSDFWDSESSLLGYPISEFLVSFFFFLFPVSSYFDAISACSDQLPTVFTGDSTLIKP